MGSDRARVTYDPRQQYRSVVMQQGRLTLEADWNEAFQINNESLRKESLDFVGPCGTPDDGYAVILPTGPTTPPYDFSIGRGAMYVGGMRTHLDEPVAYSNQPDWRDNDASDPDWVDLAGFTDSPSSLPSNEFVYLYLREQEVSAVEDFDLKDVALGGPDTAQRTRLLQRFVRLAAPGTDCASSLAAAQAKWATEGLYFDSHTMRLYSWSSLQVSFSQQGPNTDPCQPLAQGGYLDPDNQLIRVQIAGVDSMTGNPTFLWGFDDASFLYRISVDSNNPQNLVFENVPVDSSHQPQNGQVVEVLRTAADLPNSGEIASLSGSYYTLDKNYIPEQQMVVLPTGYSLPADYLSAASSPSRQLFLRVWQGAVTVAPGTPAPLGDTGVLVTLTPHPNMPFHIGDYWMFAVRPATPQTVYPERYQNAPQPPEGPRLWVCPLGVITWNEQVGTLASDCRNRMCNLVDLCKRQQGCCTFTVRPQDLTDTNTLQSILYRASSPTMLVQAATAGAPGNNIQVEISNLNLNVSPPTFDLTVYETDVYAGVSNIVQDSKFVGSSLGTDGLAHMTGNSTQLDPLNNQQISFSGGDANTKAQAQIRDSLNQQVAFILEARGTGTDGNLTTASITNVSGSPSTFDLVVAWQKTLPGLNMATLFPNIQNSLGYEIVATPSATVAPSFPAAGITQLSGGAEPVDPSAPQSAATAQARIFGNPSKICLGSGNYILSSPLVFGPEQSNITLEGCGGVTISAQGDKSFFLGMVELNAANNIVFANLTFDLPRIVFFQTGRTLGGLDKAYVENIGEVGLLSLDASIGIRILGCKGVNVEDCSFVFPETKINNDLFAVAIFGGADCSEITVLRNLFLGPAALQSLATTGVSLPTNSICVGFLQADKLEFTTFSPDLTTITGGTLVPSSLNNIVVSANSFDNLAFPVAIITALGSARFQDNVIASCYTGFTILPLLAGVTGSTQAALGNDTRYQVLSSALSQRMIALAVAYPHPSSFVPTRQVDAVAMAATPPPSSGPTPPPVSPPPTPAPAATTPSATVSAGTPSTTFVPRTLPPQAVAAATAAGRVAAGAVSTRIPTSVIRVPLAPVVVPPAPAPGTPTHPAPITLGSTLRSLSPLATRVSTFMNYLGSFAESVYPARFITLFSIVFSNNDISTIMPGGSLWTLAVVDIAALLSLLGINVQSNEAEAGSITLTGNRLRNAAIGLFGYAVSLMVFYSAVTGNVVMNLNGDKGGSLAIFIPNSDRNNGAIGAITGNVLIGTSVLPPRTDGQYPAWQTYNYNP